MIDYFETKSQPITKAMVITAYRKVKSNKGSGGVDGMNWEELDKDLTAQLYKLWNRLSSGSYFPLPVKEVEIGKKKHSHFAARLGPTAVILVLLAVT